MTAEHIDTSSICNYFAHPSSYKEMTHKEPHRPGASSNQQGLQLSQRSSKDAFYRNSYQFIHKVHLWGKVKNRNLTMPFSQPSASRNVMMIRGIVDIRHL
jgi:hypothetical protein